MSIHQVRSFARQNLTDDADATQASADGTAAFAVLHGGRSPPNATCVSALNAELPKYQWVDVATNGPIHLRSDPSSA
jgi:hypothetical protein